MSRLTKELEKILQKCYCGVPWKQNSEAAITIEKYILNKKPIRHGVDDWDNALDEWNNNLGI